MARLMKTHCKKGHDLSVVGVYITDGIRCKACHIRNNLECRLRKRANKPAYAPPKGSLHFNWRGGRYINSGGYAVLHFGNGKFQLEHRHVMEKHIGRKLGPRETVHHINGDRVDNRIDNLELWTHRHGKGQRVTDTSVADGSGDYFNLAA